MIFIPLSWEKTFKSMKRENWSWFKSENRSSKVILFTHLFDRRCGFFFTETHKPHRYLLNRIIADVLLLVKELFFFKFIYLFFIYFLFIYFFVEVTHIWMQLHGNIYLEILSISEN